MQVGEVIKNNDLQHNFFTGMSLLKVGDIKKIEPSDEEDFYQILQLAEVNPRCFENNWPYIIQATRNIGFVYKNNKTRIYFYFRKSVSYDELVIVNMFGEEKIEALSILKEHAILTGFHLCIKNIPIRNLDYWNKIGYCEKTECWDQYSQRDDNSFPECLYDLGAIALSHLPIESGKVRPCRESHANTLRKFIKERNIKVEEYIAKKHKDAVYNLLIENANFLSNKGVDSRQNVIDAHVFVFDDNLAHKIRLVHVENDCFLGFNYLTVVNNVIFGNALIHINADNLMRFLAWQGFNYLYNKLDRDKKYYVTMQGSENYGQYCWKKGFGPSMEILKTHLTYSC